MRFATFSTHVSDKRRSSILTGPASPSNTPALAGIRVVETAGMMSAYCGKLLASLGADVVKLEPAGGDPARLIRTHRERETSTIGSAFWYNNLGKRSVECDLETAAGRVLFETLVGECDVVLSGLHPTDLDRLGIAPDDLLARFPWAVIAAITPFGLTGPFRDYLATDSILLASGGQMYLTGYPDRRPLRYGGFQGYKEGAIHAAYGSLLALSERMRSGSGQIVDVSVQECVANSLQTTMQLFDLTGEVRQRVGSRLIPCADGFVRNLGVARGWQALIQWLDDERFPHNLDSVIAQMSPSERPSDELTEQIESTLAVFFAGKTKRQVFEQALERRIALAPVNSAADVLAMPELEERGFWTTVDDAQTRSAIRVPNGPFRMTPAALVPPSALTGDPSDTPGWSTVNPRSTLPLPTAATAPPLSGVVVADFTWYGAGAMATRVLAHFGATVVKIESSQRIDGIRLSPPFRGEPGVNKSGFFNNFNSGKLSITLDMHNSDAQGVAERLITAADVVADNFSPGVLASFGLTDQRIHELNPCAVILHMPMGGTSGQLMKAVGFGATIEAVSGLVNLMGDPDRAPVGTEVNYPDYGSNPYHAASAVLAGLLAVRRSGEGQVIELAQVESTVSFVGEALVETQRTGHAPGREGNVTPEAVFNEVLACSGDDEWCAVSCRDTHELLRLLDLAGLAPAALDDVQPLGLSEHHRRLADRIGSWSRGLEKYGLAAHLQQHGIPAYPLINASDLLQRDSQLAARGHHVRLEHPEAGWVTFDNPSVRLSRTPGAVGRPAPCLGEHTEHILRELLGMDTAEINALHESGALV